LIEKATLIEYGLFKKSSVGNLKETNISSPTGYFIITDDILLIKETTKIKVDIGTVIGIKYHLGDSSNKGLTDFQCRILHPKLTNPKNNISFSQTTEDKHNYANDTNFDFYEFEENWELVTGIWTFQIFVNNKLLLNQEFCLTVS